MNNKGLQYLGKLSGGRGAGGAMSIFDSLGASYVAYINKSRKDMCSDETVTAQLSQSQ